MSERDFSGVWRTAARTSLVALAAAALAACAGGPKPDVHAARGTM